MRSSRREFLKTAATTGAALAIAAGANSPALAADPDVQMSVARLQAKPETPEALQAAATKLTNEALRNLGGMARFVKKGASVWVKPNINFHRSPEFAANTHPEVVAAVVRACFEAGAAKVRVGDHSAFGSDVSYPMSGIEAAAKAAGAEVVYLDESKFKEFPLAGKELPAWRLCPEIVESDLVISVPVAKRHPLPIVSACMKNLMGIAGGDRSKWHDKLSECVCDLTAFLKPRLSVMDALRCIMTGPPRGGNLEDLKFFGVVAAGTDIVAMDAFASELLGCKPADIGIVATASARGLGQIDYHKLNLVDKTIA